MRSPELAAAVIEIISAAAVVVDDAGVVVLDNPTARSLGLVERGRIVDQAARALVDQARWSGARREAELALTGARGPAVVQAAAVPIGAAHVGLVAQDVSESHRVEAVRRDFVANVSHELKTPVGALAVLAEALLEASEDASTVRRFAARVEREATRLEHLVADLIELSRLQGAEPLPQLELVQLDRVVGEAIDRARQIATARSIEIITGGERGLVVRGHEGQLVTALANLLDNAIGYSGAHTRVQVRTARGHGTVEVTVTDQGIGISPADQERIFERFYRADPARARATGGTGLGLAIVKHAVENHGGAVEVHSTEGVGSTFALRLPAIPAGAETDLRDKATS